MRFLDTKVQTRVIIHTCSRFFKYLKTYAFYPHKGIYFLIKGNKILYKIVVLCFIFK